MKIMPLAIAALLLAACAGDTLPADADVWRAAGTGSGPHGGTLGSPLPRAVSVADHFRAGGAPYPGLCDRLVTGVGDACTAAEMRAFPQHARWRQLELPAAPADRAAALAVEIRPLQAVRR